MDKVKMLLIISNQQLGIGSLTGPLQSSPPPSSLPFFRFYIWDNTCCGNVQALLDGRANWRRKKKGKMEGGKKKGRKKLQMSLAFASQPAMWRRHTHGVLQNRQKLIFQDLLNQKHFCYVICVFPTFSDTLWNCASLLALPRLHMPPPGGFSSKRTASNHSPRLRRLQKWPSLVSSFSPPPPHSARRRSRRHSFPYKNDVRRKKNRKKGRRKRPSLLLSSPLNAP